MFTLCVQAKKGKYDVELKRTEAEYSNLGFYSLVISLRELENHDVHSQIIDASPPSMATLSHNQRVTSLKNSQYRVQLKNEPDILQDYPLGSPTSGK